MRVLQVLDNLSRDSGVSSVVVNLYNHIDQKRVRMDFLIFKEGNDSYIDEIESSGGKVYCLKNPLSIKQVLLAIIQIDRFFKTHSNEYDVIHVHSPSLCEFTLKPAMKNGIKSRIIHSHSSMTSPSRVKRLLNSYLQRNIQKYANYFWACSHEAAVFLYGEALVNQNKVTIIRNAINPEKYHFDDSVRTLIRNSVEWNDKTICIHISNYSRIKNVQFLVAVIKKLTDNYSTYRFLFIGDGPTKNELEEMLEKENLSKYCFFTGRTNRVSDFLNAADLLLLPSLKEGLPVVVVEAQATGLPCILSNTITKEVNVGNVQYVNLNFDEWIDTIVQTRKCNSEDRSTASESFRNCRFNILKEAERVQALYNNLGRDK